MADTVLAYVNQHNRPFSAQNVADALGKQGIKKGLSQKYLDTLVEQGKLNIKEAGKQKVSELAARGGAEISHVNASLRPPRSDFLSLLVSLCRCTIRFR